jgi:hypothetical protein
MTELANLYYQDYTQWARSTAELIKAGRFAELDIEHLLEELTDMGMSEKRELESRLRVLLCHLLKWQFQYRQLSERWQEFDGRSWRSTITTQRAELQLHLRKHPNMKRFVSEAIEEAYQDARVLAAKESKLAITTFPPDCPYTQAEILDDEFYPEFV